MDQPKDLIQTLHKLDTRLSVVETLQQERNSKATEEYAAIMSELSKTREAIVSLRVKTASVSGVVALVTAFLVHVFTSK